MHLCDVLISLGIPVPCHIWGFVFASITYGICWNNSISTVILIIFAIPLVDLWLRLQVLCIEIYEVICKRCYQFFTVNVLEFEGLYLTQLNIYLSLFLVIAPDAFLGCLVFQLRNWNVILFSITSILSSFLLIMTLGFFWTQFTVKDKWCMFLKPDFCKAKCCCSLHHAQHTVLGMNRTHSSLHELWMLVYHFLKSYVKNCYKFTVAFMIQAFVFAWSGQTSYRIAHSFGDGFVYLMCLPWVVFRYCILTLPEWESDRFLVVWKTRYSETSVTIPPTRKEENWRKPWGKTPPWGFPQPVSWLAELSPLSPFHIPYLLY